MHRVRLWRFFLIMGAVLLGFSLATQSSATSLPAPQATPIPQEIVIQLGSEPASLYLYDPDAGIAAAQIRSALMEGPYIGPDYHRQAPILTEIPEMGGPHARLIPITVTAGMTVVNDAGDLITLTAGSRVRPAGCRYLGCAVTFTGASLVMEQWIVTYTLRPTIRWSDGMTLTALDSVYGKVIACNAATAAAPKDICQRTSSYYAIDDLSAKWTGVPGFLDRTYNLHFWTPLPYHVLSHTTASEILSGSYGRAPLGWGPFRITEWITNDHITVERNPYYWRTGYPLLDKITFRFQGDAYHEMLLGNVQVATYDNPAGADHRSELLLPQNKPGALIYWRPSTILEHMDFNMQPETIRYPFFTDRLVRIAIAYAVDKQTILDTLYDGLGEVATSYVITRHPVFTEGITYPYSPVMATRMLTTAGWADSNGDGIMEKFGQPLHFTHTTTTAPERITLTTLIQQNLAAVGISMTLQYSPSNQFFTPGENSLLFGRHFDSVNFAWAYDTWNPACEIYMSDQIPNSTNNWTGSNVAAYNSSAYDGNCSAARTTFTPSLALANHQETGRRLSEDLPIIPLYFRPEIGIASPVIEAAEPSLDPGETSELWNVWAWSVAASVIVPPPYTTTLTAAHETFHAVIPSNSFTQSVYVTHTARLIGNLLSAGQRSLGTGHQLSMATFDGLSARPDISYTMVLSYSDAAVSATGLRESSLQLYYYTGRGWAPVADSTLDMRRNTITAKTNSTGLFAIMGDTRLYLPIVMKTK